MKNRTLTDREFRTVIGATFSIMLLMVSLTLDIPIFWKQILSGDVVLCFVVGMLGGDRKIGFMASYALSLVLSPLIGSVIALASPRTKGS